MAERVTSPAVDNHLSHIHDGDSSAPQTTSQIVAAPFPEQPQSQSESLFASGTYVVQIPKDQIYRVPPPENALIVERHRNPVKSNKTRSHCLRCVCVLVSVAIVVVVLGVVAALVPVFIRPKDPRFKINKIIANNIHSRQEYDIKLKVENPNGIGSISFNQGGRASLSFRTKEIASSKYPAFRQDHGTSRVVSLVLPVKPKVILPKGMETSLKSNKRSKQQQQHVSLSLKMKLPAEIKSSLFSNRDVQFVVTCSFTVDTLAKGSRILSQNCQSRH